MSEHHAALAALERSAWPAYLDEHSGLPGPRGNIELALAVADAGDPALFDELVASGDEYRTFCGVVGLGGSAGDDRVAARMHGFSSDPRWRVREAVAIGLQRLGDTDLLALERIALAWALDPDPLVARAAAAAICEPRLLVGRPAAATAIEVCRRATARLRATPAEHRRDPDVRTLRQGLGYCWSVAVAADPVPGLAAFAELTEDPDPDVVWVARQNRTKKRLARLLPQ